MRGLSWECPSCMTMVVTGKVCPTCEFVRPRKGILSRNREEDEKKDEDIVRAPPARRRPGDARRSPSSNAIAMGSRRQSGSRKAPERPPAKRRSSGYAKYKKSQK